MSVVEELFSSTFHIRMIYTFQKLINRPEMNCSMSIFPYFYFSNNILFDFPGSGLIFCSWPCSDLGSIKRSILCKMRWRGTTWYNVTVMHISTVIGGKARYHILDANLTLFEWTLSVRFTREFELWPMLTGCLCVRIVIPWRDLFLEEVAVSVGRMREGSIPRSWR